MPSLSTPQINSLIRTITGPFSIFGSCVILYLIWAGNGKKNAYHRFMIGISLSDIVFTITFLFGVTSVPKVLAPGAMGNMTTCELRAFFFQWFGVLEPLYNVCLEFYFVAVICYNIKPEDFTKRFEKWMHIFVNILAFGVAIIGIAAKIYNPIIGKVSGCYINSYPQGCKGQECIRGEHARVYFFFLGIFPYYIILFLLYGSLILIVWTVLRKDCKTRRFRQRSQQYTFDSSSEPPQQQAQPRRRINLSFTERSVLSITRPVTTQAISYGVVFSLTYLLHAIFRTIIFFDKLATNKRSVVAIGFLAAFFLPLQGFFNLILYIKPKFNKLRKLFPSKSFCWTLWMSISRKPIQDILTEVCNNGTRGGNAESSARGEDKNDDDPCVEELSSTALMATSSKEGDEKTNGDRGGLDATHEITRNSDKESRLKPFPVLVEPDDDGVVIVANMEEENDREGIEVCHDVSNHDEEQG